MRRFGMTIAFAAVLALAGCATFTRSQMNLFVDYEAIAREKRLQGIIGEIRLKYGMNALFTAKNLLKGATQLERNQQIGGHRA